MATIEAIFAFNLGEQELNTFASVLKKILNGSNKMGFIKDFTNEEFEFLNEMNTLINGDSKSSSDVTIMANRETFVGND